MRHEIDEVVCDDSDRIYELAFDQHGLAFVADVQDLSRDWRPLSRAALATDYLVRNGFAEFATVHGSRCLRLTNPLNALTGESAE